MRTKEEQINDSADKHAATKESHRSETFMTDKATTLRHLDAVIQRLEEQPTTWQPLSRDHLSDKISAPAGQPPTTSAPTLPCHPSPSLATRFGDQQIDSALPGGGLEDGTLHEIHAPAGSAGAASGLLVRLIGQRMKATSGPILWCLTRRKIQEKGMPWAPGLRAAGVDPNRLFFIRCKRSIDVLWAMEEALQESAVGAVVGDLDSLDLTASRRLSLKAKASGVPAFMLLDSDQAKPTVCQTRWDIINAPGQPDRLIKTLPGDPSWQAHLIKAKGTSPQDWQLEWRQKDATDHFAVVASLANRAPSAPNAESNRDVQTVIPLRKTA